MSDDFGTVNVKRGDRAQEIEVLRQHYNLHRDTLTRMVPDAPTQHLATEYQRLVADIDASIRKLNELEGRTSDAGFSETQRMGTSPGNRPLLSPDPVADHPITSYAIPADTPSTNSSRLLLMLVIFLAVLGGIGWLIWRASSDHKTATTQVIEQPATATNAGAAPAVTTAPVPAVPSIKVAPEVADYGVILKGTRAVRQFEVTNTTTAPLTIAVARSACRCLYYEYNTKAKLAAKSKEVLTVTVDGARAKAGVLEEKIAVTSKDDPKVSGTIGVRATIK
jgi:Protein of unknown function (DUF1573).